MSELAHPATEYGIVESEPPEVLARNLVTAGAPARERDGVLLPRVRLRVLLPPLAEQRTVSGGRSTSTRRSPGEPRSSCASSPARWRPARARGPSRATGARQWRAEGTRRARARRRSRSCSRSSSGRSSASARPTAATRASSSAGPASTSCSCSARCSGSRRCSRRSFRYRGCASGATTVAPGEASGDPGRPGDDIARPAVARAAPELEALLLLLDVPRGDRRPHVDRPLPRVAAEGVERPAAPGLRARGEPVRARRTRPAGAVLARDRVLRRRRLGADRARPPLDPLGDALRAHMTQHVLLLTVAAAAARARPAVAAALAAAPAPVAPRGRTCARAAPRRSGSSAGLARARRSRSR